MGLPIFHRPGIPGWVPDALMVAPRSDGGLPPIIVVHGILRNVQEMVKSLAPAAEAAGRTLVLPVFARAHWPRYQRAACPARADQALLRLIDALEAEARITPGPFDLSGFSGGAQFAHRFAWAYPSRVGRLSVASAGWWTFPDTAPYPRGMGPAEKGLADAPFWLNANMRAFLNREIVVRVGSADNVVDRNTRSTPQINAQQGRDRLTRARRWTAALRKAARTEGLPDRIDFSELPGCGHDFVNCAAAGLDIVFVPAQGRIQFERNAA